MPLFLAPIIPTAYLPLWSVRENLVLCACHKHRYIVHVQGKKLDIFFVFRTGFCCLERVFFSFHVPNGLSSLRMNLAINQEFKSYSGFAFE